MSIASDFGSVLRCHDLAITDPGMPLKLGWSFKGLLALAATRS
jgi:hypothetical protein